MAIDTRDKRASCLFGIYKRVWPQPDVGTETQNDRRQMAGLYSGFPPPYVDGAFFEDFKASPLDSAVWAISDGFNNGSLFGCEWDTASVSVNPAGAGILTVSLFPNAALSPPNSGGQLRTVDHHGYGLYEVSMKTGSVAGVDYGFFLYTGAYEGNPWDEIDLEFATFGPGYDHVKLQCNYFTNGVGGHEVLVELGFNPASAFHTYAFQWLSGSLKWYVDGTQVASATASLPTTSGQIYVNIWNPVGVTSWTGGPYNGTTTSAQVDWIRYTPVSVVTDNTARNKRATVLGLDGIYRMVLPVPDGAITAVDRYQLAGKYAGLGGAAPAALQFRNRTDSRFRFAPSFPC